MYRTRVPRVVLRPDGTLGYEEPERDDYGPAALDAGVSSDAFGAGVRAMPAPTARPLAALPEVAAPAVAMLPTSAGLDPAVALGGVRPTAVSVNGIPDDFPIPREPLVRPAGGAPMEPGIMPPPIMPRRAGERPMGAAPPVRPAPARGYTPREQAEYEIPEAKKRGIGGRILDGFLGALQGLAENRGIIPGAFYGASGQGRRDARSGRVAAREAAILRDRQYESEEDKQRREAEEHETRVGLLLAQRNAADALAEERRRGKPRTGTAQTYGRTNPDGSTTLFERDPETGTWREAKTGEGALTSAAKPERPKSTDPRASARATWSAGLPLSEEEAAAIGRPDLAGMTKAQWEIESGTRKDPTATAQSKPTETEIKRRRGIAVSGQVERDQSVQAARARIAEVQQALDKARGGVLEGFTTDEERTAPSEEEVELRKELDRARGEYERARKAAEERYGLEFDRSISSESAAPSGFPGIPQGRSALTR